MLFPFLAVFRRRGGFDFCPKTAFFTSPPESITQSPLGRGGMTRGGGVFELDWNVIGENFTPVNQHFRCFLGIFSDGGGFPEKNKKWWGFFFPKNSPFSPYIYIYSNNVTPLIILLGQIWTTLIDNHRYRGDYILLDPGNTHWWSRIVRSLYYWVKYGQHPLVITDSPVIILLGHGQHPLVITDSSVIIYGSVMHNTHW